MHQAPLRKLASQNAVFKKAFARSCADRLRGIEGRLDRGCGINWTMQLEECDDMHTVAKLLLFLQRRSGALRGIDCSWIEEISELSQSSLDEQQADLKRRLMHRIDELDRAVPPARHGSRRWHP